MSAYQAFGELTSSSSTSTASSCASSCASPSAVHVVLRENDRIVFASDIEGNYDYWTKWISSSDAFEYVGDTERKGGAGGGGRGVDNADGNNGALHECLWDLKDNYIFVFVGDVCDRGDGDCRLLFDLVHLKNKHPTRIYSILGNRDQNKLRLYAELDAEIVALEVKPGVFWTRSEPKTPWASRADKLKWILVDNMGAPDSFEHRRNELKILFKREAITDEEVLESYMDLIDPKYSQHRESSRSSRSSNSPTLTELSKLSPSESPKAFARGEGGEGGEPSSPYSNIDKRKENPVSDMSAFSRTFGGILLRYLMGASIGILLGDVIVVHGGLNDENMGWIPPTHACLGGWDEGNYSNVADGIMAQYFESLYRFKVSTTRSNSIDMARNCRQELISWLEGLEDFKNEELSDYISSSRKYVDFYVNQSKALMVLDSEVSPSRPCVLWSKMGGHFHYQPASRLLAYGMSINAPGSGVTDNRINAGVIYYSYIYSAPAKTDPMRVNSMSRHTCDFLARSGVSRLVVGHQPVGDLPLIINNGRLQVICLDTSYSSNVRWKAEDLLVEQPEEKLLPGGLTDVIRKSLPNDPAYVAAVPSVIIDNIISSSRRSSSSSSKRVAKEIPFEYTVNPKNSRGFTVAHVEIVFKAWADDGQVASDNCFFRGRLSNGQVYSHQLYNPTRYESSSSSAGSRGVSTESSNLSYRLSKLLGKQTKDGGWILRSYGVSKSYRFDLCNSSGGGGVVLLLSSTSGFNVYNRYVSASELSNSGISLDPPANLPSGFESLESCFALISA